MIRFLADENFDGRIVRGLIRQNPALDLVRIQDIGLGGWDDPDVLEWAAHEGRVLLTHDVRTITDFAYDRLTRGLTFAGVIEVPLTLGIGAAIADLLLIAEAATPSELENQIRYLPL